MEWEFSNLEISIFFNLSEIYSTEFFQFSLFLLLCVIKDFHKNKYGVTGLVFKIDAIDGKKWVKCCCYAREQCNLNL